MSFYCGTDIIEVARVKDAINRTAGFKEKVFTTEEIAFAEAKGEAVKYQHYAGRFAAKEAVYKALSNIDSSFEFGDIEISNNKENKDRPVVSLKKKIAVDGLVKIDVSISHVKEYAVANAVVSIDN